MSKLYHLLLFMALCLRLSSAEATSRESHCFYGSEGLSAKEISGDVWIMTGRAAVADKEAQAMVSDSIYWEQINDSGEFFRLINDSVFWKGVNLGRRYGCLVDDPICLSSGHCQRYSASGRLDGYFTLSVEGSIEWSELGRGQVVLTPTDTIDDVRLTRLVRTVEVEDEQGLMVDSIVSYRWFASGLAIPVAIQRDGVLYTISSENLDVFPDYTDSQKDESKRISDIINHASFDHSGSKITITLPEPLEAEAYIMDLSGNIFGRASGKRKTFCLTTDNLLPRTYLVAVRSTLYPECVYEILLTITE